MRVWKHTMMLAAAAIVAWPLASGTAIAARGDHGGGGEHGGGGQESGARSGGGDRSFSGGHDRGDRGQSPRQFSRGDEGIRSQANRSGGEGQQQRSFYRGPDTSQFDRQSNRDDAGSRNRDRDRDRADNDRDRDFDRDREFARDRDNDRFDRNQFDFNRDRNDWDRLGRDIRRNWWRGSDWNDAPFRYGWWNSYSGAGWPAYSPWRYSRWSNRPYYWWGYTPATALSNWLVFGWDRPRYWAYGPGRNIYYQDGYVYYDNRRTIATNDYYQDMYELAHSVPNISEEEAQHMDWKPLGVFALARQNESQGQSQRALQLAVNKDGVLTGTYYNRENGHVHPVSGMVDDRTQRAAWAFADGEHDDVVFETAFYNLDPRRQYDDGPLRAAGRRHRSLAPRAPRAARLVGRRRAAAAEFVDDPLAAVVVTGKCENVQLGCATVGHPEAACFGVPFDLVPIPCAYTVPCRRQARVIDSKKVPLEGVEPPLSCENMDLNHARLPIPPQRPVVCHL